MCACHCKWDFSISRGIFSSIPFAPVPEICHTMRIVNRPNARKLTNFVCLAKSSSNCTVVCVRFYQPNDARKIKRCSDGLGYPTFSITYFYQIQTATITLLCLRFQKKMRSPVCVLSFNVISTNVHSWSNKWNYANDLFHRNTLPTVLRSMMFDPWKSNTFNALGEWNERYHKATNE